MSHQTADSKQSHAAIRIGRRVLPHTVGLLGIAVMVGLSPLRASGDDRSESRQTLHQTQFAQETNDTDESEVSPAQVEKYVAVYKAMQRDRSLTVEAASAENGMTVEAFRALESRVERDEAAMARARQLLQASAAQPQSTKTP
ncbi:MAG TPA: hypothetical protein VMT61_05460 [Candidatus Binataceae bacterium]|nr:hypothetical protein [Candidatus Binataceae bacterium]